LKVDLVDNKGNNTLIQKMKNEVKKGSSITISSAKFSINVFKELKKIIDKGDSFRFLFTESTFYQQEIDINQQFKVVKRSKEKFEIEGNHFEIPLRNQMQTKQIARELSEWISNHAQFKTILGEVIYPKQILIENKSSEDILIQSEIDFTADGLGITPSNRQSSYTFLKEKAGITKTLLSEFNRIWQDDTKSKEITEEVLQQLNAFQKENSPEWLYFVTLYSIFSENIDGFLEENVIKEGTNFKETIIWNKLYPFQRDGVIGIIDKIEKHNGCILADSVGLGKTFSALAVIKYYELRNNRVLVLCPKKLRDNWTIYTQNDKRNILSKDRFNYDVLNHTDLSRESGMSDGVRLDTINWGNYDLVVIDESHNFRNNIARQGRLTRYQKLMQDIIKNGVKTKVLLLSATPVNNKMNDMKNQIAFITEDKDNVLQKEGIESIEKTLRLAQAAFNRWATLPVKIRTTEKFLDMVDQDYFQLLDLLTIARSRKHIEKYYNVTDVGSFPTRLKPISIKSDVDTRQKFINMSEVNEKLESLNFSIYQPMKYILPHRINYYENLYDTKVKNGQSTFKQTDREYAVAALMKVNLFKRLESSIHAFRLTLEKLVSRIEETLLTLQLRNEQSYSERTYDDTEFDDEQLEAVTVGSDKVKVQLSDIDALKWSGDLRNDLTIIQTLLNQSKQISTDRDAKLEHLIQVIQKKIENPINPGNKKVIIFSAFADTVKYLYENLSERLLNNNLHSALVTGSSVNKCTLKGVRLNNINDILMNFSPISKERNKVFSKQTSEIDILFATDCISEGQNLQDCDYLINYDIHWNPVRVIQRFGRIDRIGSINEKIQLVNFWPNMELDEYINLEERVKGRMKMLSTSASGEEDFLETSSKEMNDLEYRRNQLKSLQNDVLNLEDISGAISITDLTYNDFKSDLGTALKNYKKELSTAVKGLYAVITNESLPGAVPGVIFCVKQHKKVAMENNNLGSHILLYVTDEGKVFIHYTHAKKILDVYRKLTLGYNEPDLNAVNWFNEQTNDAVDMDHYQELLKKSINIIKDKQDEVGFESLFNFGTSILQAHSELDETEIELISFLVIKDASL